MFSTIVSTALCSTPKISCKLYGVDMLGTLYEENSSNSRIRDAGSGFELQICSIDKNGFKKID